MAKPDYYAILQVDPGAEAEVIQAAYRRLAAKYHPDVNPSPQAEKRMKQINAAYEILSHPGGRRAYNRVRPGTSHPEPVAEARPPGLPWTWWVLPLSLGLFFALRLKSELLIILGLSYLFLWLGRARHRSN